MVFISICVGSSCHLKGSERLVELMEERIREERLENDVVLSGSFCLGKCNRVGVTVSVGDGDQDAVYTGITPEGFSSFWRETVVPMLEKSGK